MDKYYKTKTICWKMESKVHSRGARTTEKPMWMINNYIKSTCDNYAKLVYILSIIDIFSNEESNVVDIGISTCSAPVDQDGIDFENKLISHVKGQVLTVDNRLKVDKGKEKYCLMSFVPEGKEKGFWHYFNYCERPICFAITKDNETILLYNPRGNEGIKVRDISYHSPIDIGWGGISEIIELLVNAGTQAKNDRRLQDEHEAKMVNHAMQTMKEAINVQNMLQNANLPGSHKVYLQNMYAGIMAKQEKLNEKIGICSSGFDERA